ncbi:TPA: hypothetical protein ACYEMF_004326, partial [Klebsiella pneumoniae]|uniref:hypothetical protein n=1 Tax=Klebsiella pneumoniae TaxID=573 RepID=UPI001C6FB87E
DGLHSNISVFVTLSDTPVSYPPPIELPINELALIIGVLMTDGVEPSTGVGPPEPYRVIVAIDGSG